MRHFKNQHGDVFGYDDTQLAYINAALSNGWQELAVWPPPKTLEQVKSSKIAALDALLGDWKTPRIALANGAGKPKITFTGADQIQVVILAWLGLASGGGASVILTDVDGNSGTVTKSLLDSFVPLWVAEHNRVRGVYAQRKAAIDAATSAAEVVAVDTSNPL